MSCSLAGAIWRHAKSLGWSDAPVLLPKEKEAAKERALRQITPVFSMTRRRCAREY